MARVSMGRQWADGERIWVTVKADDSFPESLTQARMVANGAFAEMCVIVLDPADVDLATLGTPEAD